MTWDHNKFFYVLSALRRVNRRVKTLICAVHFEWFVMMSFFEMKNMTSPTFRSQRHALSQFFSRNLIFSSSAQKIFLVTWLGFFRIAFKTFSIYIIIILMLILISYNEDYSDNFSSYRSQPISRYHPTFWKLINI